MESPTDKAENYGLIAVGSPLFFVGQRSNGNALLRHAAMRIGLFPTKISGDSR